MSNASVLYGLLFRRLYVYNALRRALRTHVYVMTATRASGIWVVFVRSEQSSFRRCRSWQQVDAGMGRARYAGIPILEPGPG